MKPAGLERWLRGRLSRELGIPPGDLDPDEPLTRYGLDSRAAMAVCGDLEALVDRPVDPTLVYDHPTLRLLVEHLAGPATAESPAAGKGRAPPREPVAIVGLACRFPGSGDPRAFWECLTSGKDPLGAAPRERWAPHASAAPEPHGGPADLEGGFLDAVEAFDALFFGMSPREATRVDPQQRLLLELAWEALEDAGADPATLKGTQTAVFVGISHHEYALRFLSDPAGVDAQVVTGSSLSVAANRVSYFLDVTGPSMAVDTACSSSLVAVHLACRSLWSGEATAALAGGVNLILSPAVTYGLSTAGVLSPTSRCRSFSADADGYVRSEGGGLVLLKPLSRALADADRIHAVILGSAANHDGRSNGIMAPRRAAQEALLGAAYADAGVDPAAVAFVEAHGTGTLLGDVIEAKSAGSVLGGPARGRPCFIGSVKSNLGHLEAAAGIAGLIKSVLALTHRVLPPTRHVSEPSQQIPFADLGLALATESVPLGGGRVIGGVSSFGFGGANAHVVLATPDRPEAGEAGEVPAAHLVPVSARTPEALRTLAGGFAECLRAGTPPAGVAYTAARRAHHRVRLAVVGSNAGELAGALEDSAPAEPAVTAQAEAPVFVFPGQGPRWQADIPALRQHFATFDAAHAECTAAWASRAGAPPGGGQPDGAPAELFALQVALARTWIDLGVAPSAVAGSSVGEVAAAHVSGALSLDRAITVLAERARALRPVLGKGRMLLVELGADEAEALAARLDGPVTVAAVNSHRSVVLAGSPAAITSASVECDRLGIWRRDLAAVDYASHSPAMDGPAAAMRETLAGLTPAASTVPMVSTVTGGAVAGTELDGAYWARNLREQVRFGTAVDALLAAGHRSFVEIAARPTLGQAITDRVRAAGVEASVSCSLERDAPNVEAFLRAVGRHYVAGARIRWTALQATGTLVDLPTYPWQRTRCWSQPAAAPSPGPPSQPDAGDLEGLLHRIEWEPAAGPFGSPSSGPAGAWLVLADRGGVGEALARRLVAAGHLATVLHPDPQEGVGGLARRLDGLLHSHPNETWRAAVCLSALDAGPVDGEDAFRRAQRLVLGAVTGVYEALSRASIGVPVYLVTRGAQPAGRDVTAPVQALLWGFGRAARAERPRTPTSLVDLDVACGSEEAARALYERGLGRGDEAEVALRGDRVLVPRWHPLEEPVGPLACSPSGTYLVTGGLGDLGLRMAEELVDCGARRLLVVGRTALPARSRWAALDPGSRAARAVRAIRSMESSGVSVHVAAVDVADPEALAHFLRSFADEGWPPIRGVLHAAGVADVRAIGEATEAEIAEVLRPKLLGGSLLDTALAGAHLDFFVLCSSVSAVLPSPLLATYAAGNAFLDALALDRHARGLPATSIQWGLWRGSTMPGRFLEQRPSSAERIPEITPEEGRRAFRALAAAQPPNAAVLRLDGAGAPAERGRSGGRPAEQPGAQAGTVGERSLLAELLLLAPSGRDAAIASYLQVLIASELGLAEGDIGPDSVLHDFGLDSVSAIELRNRLEHVLGVSIAMSALLQAHTVRALSTTLAGLVEAEISGEGLDDLARFVGQLSEDEVARMLADPGIQQAGEAP